MALRNLIVRVGADITGLQRSMNQATSEIKKFSGGIESTIGRINKVLGTIGAAMGIGSAIKDAMAYETAMNQVNRIMGQSSDEFQNFAETTASAFGFSKLQAIQAGATYGNLLSTFSNGAAETTAKTEELMKATAVVASGTGRTMDDVFERIRSGLLGNTEAIEDLGINVNVAMLQSTAAFQRFANGKSWDQLSFQTQQQIRYMAILEQASEKYGTTIADSTAQRLNFFVQALLNVKLALGQAFLPILNVVLPILTSLANSLAVAMGYVSQFIRALVGSKGDIPAQTTMLQQQTAAVTNLGNAQVGQAKAATKAAKANEKAKGSLAGFDQINQLADNTASADTGDTGGGGGGGIGGGGGVSIPAPSMDTKGTVGGVQAISKAVKEMADKVKAFLAPLKGPWQHLVDQVKAVWTSLKDLWNSPAFVAFRGWAAKAARWAVGKALDLLADGFESLSGVIDTINGVINGDHKKAMEGLKKIFSSSDDKVKVLKAGIFGLTGAIMAQAVIDGIVSLYKKWKAATTAQTTVQWLLNAAMDANPLGIIALAIGALIAIGILLYQNWDTIKEKASDLWDGITKAFGKVADWFGKNVKDPVVRVWTDLKNSVTTKASDAWNSVKSKFTDAYNWFKTNVADKITTAFANVKEAVKSKASDIWEGVKGKFLDVYNWFKKNVADKIASAFNAIHTNVTDAITSAFRTVYNKAAGWINGMIGTLNGMIGALNKVIPNDIGVVPKIKYSVPYLAEGGIVSKATLAVVGEGSQDEAITPIDKLQGIVTNAVLSAMQFMNGNNKGNTGDVVLNIDGRALARVIKPLLDQETKRVGTNLRLNTI